jgi:hypothetical protein
MDMDYGYHHSADRDRDRQVGAWLGRQLPSWLTYCRSVTQLACCCPAV